MNLKYALRWHIHIIYQFCTMSVLYTSTHKHASSNRLRTTNWRGGECILPYNFPPSPLHLPCQQREEGILESPCSLCVSGFVQKIPAEPCVTKLGMVGHHLEVGCCANKLGCCRGQGDGAYIIKILLFVISFRPRVLLLPRLVWWSVFISQWISVIQVTANVQYFS